MWRAFGAVLLLGGIECGDRSGDLCTPAYATYHYEVHASLREPGKSAATSQGVDSTAASSVALSEGALRVRVFEGSSIVACSGDVATHATPGSTLFSKQLSARPEGVRIDLPQSFYPQLLEPDLYLEVLLDQNANGRCDDGEPSGTVSLPRSEELHEVDIELVSGPCSYRL
jgi:hypothetical protein